MSEWQLLKLGELVTLNYGKALKAEHRKPGSVPVYSSAGLTGTHDTFLVNGEGIIVGRKGTVGKVYYSAEPFCCIDTAYYIMPKPEKYNFQFLYYMLQTLGLEELNEDSAVPGLNRETAYNQQVALPPLPEQKAIASVLSSLDDKIDLLHRQNKTLEAIAETLFRQWFIKEVKEDWGEIAFGELIELHDSKRIPLSQLQRDEKRVGELYPYYGASGIIDYINAHIFEGDYLLLSEDGENLRTRKTPIAFEANGRFWVNNHAHVMQAKLPYTNGLLRILLEGENLDSIITGAVQPKINQANLISYKIPNFPHDLVQQYVTVSDPWIKKVSYNKQQILTLENLRDTLLPKLMSGEVRVQYRTQQVA